MIIRGRLKDLIRRFAWFPDPRDPRKIRHKQAVLPIYGILMFIYQLAFRRKTYQKVTRPGFQAQLRELFPEMESMPHGDTL